MTIGTETPTSRFIGKIPIRNIWLLLLYASQLYRELPAARRVEMENAPDDIPFLVAEILAKAVERRIRRNLSQGYRRRHADLNRVRGRIDVLSTERRQLLQKGSVACVFEELTVDTPRNRYVRAALDHIANVVSRAGDHSDIESRCRDLVFRLVRAGVAGHVDLRQLDAEAALDSVGWVDPQEREMVAAARLALNLLIPTEVSGLAQLPIVNRDETEGWKLFEYAVAGFYNVALSHRGWKVKQSGHMKWPYSNPTSDLHSILPDMITDIVLERRDHSVPSSGQRIVVDTKFTSIVASGNFGKETLKSGHMYQLYTYLRSQEQPGETVSCRSAGVLLYPSLGIDYNESAIIQGHRVSFATVDLTADSQTIRNQLLRVLHN